MFDPQVQPPPPPTVSSPKRIHHLRIDLTLLELQQQYTNRQEHQHPDARRNKSTVHHRLIDRPSSLRNRSQALRRLGQRQQQRHVPQSRIHSLDRPNNSAQHHDRQETAHRHVRGRSFIVASRRHHKPEAHATQTGQHGQQTHPNRGAHQRQFEHRVANQQHQHRLERHDQELGDDVREQDLHSGDAGDQTAFQHSLVPFDQHGARRECNGQEEDDGQDDAGSCKVREIGNAIAVDGFLEAQRNPAERWILFAVCEDFLDEIEEGELHVAIEKCSDLLV